MRTDRAGSQASQGTQGGTSYPRDNSQVMPVVIEIILPQSCLITDNLTRRADKIEERTSLITSATLNCLPSPDCDSSHQFFRFLQPLLFLCSPAHVKIFLRWSIYGQLFLASLFWTHSCLHIQTISLSPWLNSKWNAGVDHQVDKARSPLKKAYVEMQRIICLLLTLSLWLCRLS